MCPQKFSSSVLVPSIAVLRGSPLGWLALPHKLCHKPAPSCCIILSGMQREDPPQMPKPKPLFFIRYPVYGIWLQQRKTGRNHLTQKHTVRLLQVIVFLCACYGKCPLLFHDMVSDPNHNIQGKNDPMKKRRILLKMTHTKSHA